MSNPPANNPANWTALLKELQRIAGALETPPPTEVITEAPTETAPRLVDYLALRQLMGKRPRQGDQDRSFPATIDGTKTPPELILGPLPQGAKKVAVFVGRDKVADVVPLAGHPAYDFVKQNTKGYPLPNVSPGQVITRLEFRRADDYPLALGPRLTVV